MMEWVTGLYIKYASVQNHKYNLRMINKYSWNVKGLNRPGKLQILENTIENFTLISISEAHWKRTGHFVTTKGNFPSTFFK